jgi:hypothetical protein
MRAGPSAAELFVPLIEAAVVLAPADFGHLTLAANRFTALFYRSEPRQSV